MRKQVLAGLLVIGGACYFAPILNAQEAVEGVCDTCDALTAVQSDMFEIARALMVVGGTITGLLIVREIVW